MPPHTEITTFSISNCRTRRQRLAPSAARTAISLSREMLRASARFARLAQPISNTNSVAANRTVTAVRNPGPISTSARRSTATPQPLFELG